MEQENPPCQKSYVIEREDSGNIYYRGENIKDLSIKKGGNYWLGFTKSQSNDFQTIYI